MNASINSAFVALRSLFYAVCFVALWSWIAISVAPLDAALPVSIPDIVRVFGSPSIIGLSIAFGLLAHVFVLLYEEPVLEKKFGDSYRAYCSTVN
jgi:protein-S-isoprenylcysteine O-methyltransferase Ste14